MKKPKNWLMGVSVVAMCIAANVALADLELGIFPRNPAAASVKQFTPLANRLSEELGEKVNIRVAKDFGEFWKQVEEKKFDIVYFNQYHYLLSRDEYGYRAIVANIEDGEKTIAGALFVRSDSGINSLDDVKGKTIVFGGGPKAMGSYIAPTAILRKFGLEEGKDYTAQFAKNPPSAILAVAGGAAEVAGAGSVVMSKMEKGGKLEAGKVKILALSQPFVQLTWAVHEGMDDKKMSQIQSIMSSFDAMNEKDAEVLKAARVDGFYKVTDNDYVDVVKIANFALGR